MILSKPQANKEREKEVSEPTGRALLRAPEKKIRSGEREESGPF
jgi:hypothetical protein